MQLPEIKMIYASTPEGVIGRNNQLPWSLPEDLSLFKKKTKGCTVLMGRKTFMSLPLNYRPLPNRANVIVSSQKGLKIPGALVVNDPLAFLKQAAGVVWVIGGAQLYQQLYQFCTDIHHTEVYLESKGDAKFKFDKHDWDMVSDTGNLLSDKKIAYRVRRYKLKGSHSEVYIH